MTIPIRLVAIVLAFAGGAAAAAQQSQFKTAADVVRIFVTAVDDNGRLVPDLTKDDFEIRDDGRVRPVAVFSQDPQPIAAIVMLDRSGSVMTSVEVVERGARAFITKLRDGDVARVGSFGKLIQILPPDFTPNRNELRATLENGMQPDRNAGSPVWTAVSQSVNALSGQSSRRVVVLFSDGHDLPEFGQTRVKFSDLQRHVAEHDVMVYAIGVPGAIRPRSSQTFNPGQVMMAQTFSPPDPDMKKLAIESGGGFLELEKKQADLDAAFSRVADELHAQYLLGFTPEKLDGKMHELEVRVKRPGVKTRARQTYIAGKPAPGR
jgi:VWFA-related protein